MPESLAYPSCRYEHLSRDQRVARVGEIMAKAALLLLEEEYSQECQKTQSKESATDRATRNTVFPSDTQGDDRAEQVCRYLSTVGSAAPRDIQTLLGVSKATAFRLIRGMINDGLIRKAGRTTGVRVEMAS